jgi:hypothetical protein
VRRHGALRQAQMVGEVADAVLAQGGCCRMASRLGSPSERNSCCGGQVALRLPCLHHRHSPMVALASVQGTVAQNGTPPASRPTGAWGFRRSSRGGARGGGHGSAAPGTKPSCVGRRRRGAEVASAAGAARSAAAGRAARAAGGPGNSGRSGSTTPCCRRAARGRQRAACSRGTTATGAKVGDARLAATVPGRSCSSSQVRLAAPQVRSRTVGGGPSGSGQPPPTAGSRPQARPA